MAHLPLPANPADYARLDRLLDEALDLAPEARERWLAALGPADARLAPELRALLAGAAADPLGTLPALGTLLASSGGPGPGALVGPYRLASVLGEGGMGTVWLARRADGAIDRPVALKLPLEAAGFAERLGRERDILSGLAHPGIARLYDAGVTEAGQPYLALEYVAGRPIDVHAREERLGVAARLGLFLQAAAALAYAHGHLVVHRDLKPSNLLVTPEGGVRLLDFGIARLLGGGPAPDSDVTRAAGRALTPAYASPEQIRGEPQGVASDVFSLGVVLYELLCGVRPFAAPGGSRRALEDAILLAEPRPPSEAAAEPSARRALRGDLDTIVLKALQKAPEERYATVDAFAEDVRRYLAGLPVRARRGGALYRARKHLHRHPFASTLGAAAVAALLATTGAALLQARRALAERDRAEEAKEFIVSLLRAADPYLAGRPLTAADLLRQARTRIGTDLGARPELRVELLTAIATSLVHLQELAAADEILAEAVLDGTRSLGAAHPRTARARLVRADVHRLRGRLDELEAELAALLPLLRQAPWARPEDLANALRLAALGDVARGRASDAVPAAIEARTVAVAAAGPRSRLTLLAEIVLVHAYVAAGRPADALREAEQARALALENYPSNPRHAQALQARLAYALALGATGDRGRAVDLLRETVADARQVFGPESTVLAFALPRLAQQEVLVGELDAALADADAALRAVRGRALPESFVEAAALDARGRALLAARRAADAVPDLEAVARVEDRTAGPANPRAAAARLRLAHALALAGERARALEELARVRAAGGARAAEALLVEGLAARLAGEPDRAAALHREALQLAGGPEADLLRAGLRGQLGLDLLAAGDPRGAAAALEEATGALRGLQRRDTPERAELAAALGRARRGAGR